MVDPRITVKAFLSDGTKMSKVIYLTGKNAKPEAIMKQFENFVNNVIIRIPK